MANSKELFNDLVQSVQLDEPLDEIQSIIYLLLDHQLGLTRSDILAGKEINLGEPAIWSEIILRINRSEPIQYILGEAEFFGRSFIVNPSVLIPRPETELIIREGINAFNSFTREGGTILDIGTGSGCLAITFAKQFPNTHVVATDVSESALKTASTNAARHQVSVQFLLNNILKEALPLKVVNAIVSNPPYIPEKEKSQLNKNVLYEPEGALFVPDNDPLVFYKAIATLAWKLLTNSGKVLVEINEYFGSSVVEIFKKEGFRHVVVKRDLEGKDRVVAAWR